MILFYIFNSVFLYKEKSNFIFKFTMSKMIIRNYKVDDNLLLRTFNAFKKVNQNNKRYALVRFRFVNILILFLIFTLLIVSVYFKDSSAVFHFIKAFSEAALVGALADWFAVVALFKYPLGIPVPHTAIIPKNKIRISQSLAEFVETHFLNEDVIANRITTSNPSAQLSKWLQKSGNRDMIIQNVREMLPVIFEIFKNQDFSNFIVLNLKDSIRKINLSGILSDILEILTKNKEHEKWIKLMITSVRKLITKNKTFIKNKIEKETPWWTFGLLDNKIYNKIIDGINDFIKNFEMNKDNKLRNNLDDKIQELIVNLKHDKTLINEIDTFKNKIIENDELTNYILSFIANLTEKLNEDINDKNSIILELINSSLTKFADNLDQNKLVQQRINEFIKDITTRTISANAGKISSIITETMNTWKDKEITEELEVHIGKDLQYIRVNGAFVGGLIGIIIFLINNLIN